MILEMVAWRDPNVVPIKAFFGDDLKVNFCGKLATDHHVQVIWIMSAIHCQGMLCSPYTAAWHLSESCVAGKVADFACDSSIALRGV